MSETRGLSDPTSNGVADSTVPDKQEQRSSTASTVSNAETPLADEKRAAASAEETGTHPALAAAEDEKEATVTANEKAAATSTDEKPDASSSDQDDAAGPEDNEAHHVSGISRIILVFGLCATTFIIGLDQMIIATAIPKITTLFGSLDECVQTFVMPGQRAN